MSPTYDRGVFTLSFDFELVWGSRDLADDPTALLQMARITRDRVFDALLAMLDRHRIVATWATVGHLFLDRAERVAGRLHPDVVPPKHTWRSAPWFDGVPEGTEVEHPEFYGRSLVLKLRDAGQEIGSHSFSHPIFGDAGCSRESADSDLAQCVLEAAVLGIPLRSFVFPRNVPGHIDLLARHGFTCWRGTEPVWYRNDRVPGPVSRIAHLGDVARAARPPTVMPYKDQHGLWVIPSSSSLLPVDGVRRFLPISRRVKRAIRGIDQAAADRRISHLYTHPINLASDPSGMLGAMDAILRHAARLRDAGKLHVWSMGDIAERGRDAFSTR